MSTEKIYIRITFQVAHGNIDPNINSPVMGPPDAPVKLREACKRRKRSLDITLTCI